MKLELSMRVMRVVLTLDIHVFLNFNRVFLRCNNFADKNDILKKRYIFYVASELSRLLDNDNYNK